MFFNKMEKKKRGISPIIATVFIIMLTISAIAIIAGIVVPFVRNSLSKSTECMPYGKYFTFDESFGFNCYQSADGGALYFVSVKTGNDKNLADNADGFKLVFISNAGETMPLDIRSNLSASKTAGGVSMGGSDSAVLRLPGAGGVAVYVFNDSGGIKYKTAEVYPVLKSGRICGDEKDSISFAFCEEIE